MDYLIKLCGVGMTARTLPKRRDTQPPQSVSGITIEKALGTFTDRFSFRATGFSLEDLQRISDENSLGITVKKHAYVGDTAEMTRPVSLNKRATVNIKIGSESVELTALHDYTPVGRASVCMLYDMHAAMTSQSNSVVDGIELTAAFLLANGQTKMVKIAEELLASVGITEPKEIQKIKDRLHGERNTRPLQAAATIVLGMNARIEQGDIRMVSEEAKAAIERVAVPLSTQPRVSLKRMVGDRSYLRFVSIYEKVEL